MDAKTCFDKVIRINKNKSAKNVWMDFYLDAFKNRIAKKQKPIVTMINYLTLFCSFVVILINSIGFAYKLSPRVSMTLFDVSIFLGGIEFYMKMVIILMMFLAMALNYEIRINSYEEMSEWLLVFDICRSRLRKLFVFKGFDNQILDRVFIALKILYKLANLSIFICCKYALFEVTC